MNACNTFRKNAYRQCRSIIAVSLQYWWEVVILVQTQVLVTISVFVYSLTAYFTTVLLQVAFGILLALQHWSRPSLVDSINHMSMESLGVLVITSTVALTFFTFEIAAPPVYGEVIGVVCVLLNFGFIIWCSLNVATHSSNMVSEWGAKAKALWRKYITRRRGSTSNRLKDPAAAAAVDEDGLELMERQA